MEKTPHRSVLSWWFVIAGVLISLMATGSAHAIDYDANGTPDLLARTPDGTLWRYSGGVGTAITGTSRVPGSGWDLYDRIVAPGTWSADARPDVIGRARSVPGTGAYETLFQVMGDGAGGFSHDESLLARGESPLGWLGWGWQAFDALIAPGDWDGDGSPDLLARTLDGRLVQYHRDLVCCPVLGIRQGHPIPYGGWDGFDVILGPGDWDGDGHLDLIVRNGGALFLFRGNGVGGFIGDARSIDSGGWEAFDTLVAPGDWDGDGHADLLARRPDGTMLLYPGDGVGGIKLGGQRIGDGWDMFDLIVGGMPVRSGSPKSATPASALRLSLLKPSGSIRAGAAIRVRFRSSDVGTATVAFVRAKRILKIVRARVDVGLNAIRVTIPNVQGTVILRVSVRRGDGITGILESRLKLTARRP